ncbi:MAG: hypothetical protein AABZ55_07385 [Bdellovibrionota bacterium]
MKFKSIKISILGLALIASAGFSAPAHAIYDPNWERPTQEAEMKISKATGVYTKADKVKLTMTHRDGAGLNPTGLILTIDGQSKFFGVLQINNAGCGSVEYITYSESNRVVRSAKGAVLTLTDHTKRICLDYRPNIWEMNLTKAHDTQTGLKMSVLQAAGNPQGVFTILNELNSLSSESNVRSNELPDGPKVLDRQVHVLSCRQLEHVADNSYSVAISFSLDQKKTFATINHSTFIGGLDVLTTEVARQKGKRIRYLGEGFELTQNSVQPADHPGFIATLKAKINNGRALDLAVSCVATR